ncbi:hypothetical protein BHE90_005549 [Fusarium euwallaceae]|uniref:N-acetyltransferase domain-containing protein n=3 Tax=Fusarium solani species complex TaxID=232080 RepID=A0A3M2RXN8_9HYPO|nr:hypothetical protein CDV36_010681 [Fusarium kuroshium]RSL85963.1 hypothetical protein CEP51_003087 [Fusarium floridanum]RTE79931.1 hypothetical protein BHE90_005549 [Fusarium euwallaceae]
MEPAPIEFVTVKTTLPKLPFPSNDERKPFRTERLLMRPFSEDDFEALRVLRTQPEVMVWFTQGRPDKDVEETKKALALYLPPNDLERYNWAICLAETGEFIGIGGNAMWNGELGWPAVGYSLLKEHWGKGYITEFLRGYFAQWWALPREEVELKVDKNSVRGDGSVEKECVSAITVDDNAASQNVLRKCGFDLVRAWEETDLRDPSKMVTLYGFVATKEKSL